MSNKSLEKRMMYNEYIKYMTSEGWNYNKKIFSEKDLNVKTFSCKKGTIAQECAIKIKCLPKCIMSLCGTTSISEDDVSTKPYIIKLKLSDKNGVEIDSDTKIRINKENSGNNSYIIQLARIKYEDIKTEYKFKYGIGLGRSDHEKECIHIYIINSNLDIDKDKTELSVEIDVWSKKN